MAGRSLQRRMDCTPRRYQRRPHRLARRWPFAKSGFAEHARSRGEERVAVVSATVTVIDRSKNVMPRAFDLASTTANDPAIAAKLASLQAAAKGRDAKGILELALKGEFAGKTAVVSSFGSESVVLLHMIAQIDPTTPVIFLNTGKLFGETL